MAQNKTEVWSVEEARLYLAGGGKAKAKVKRKKTAVEKQLEEELQQHRIRELEKTGLLQMMQRLLKEKFEREKV